MKKFVSVCLVIACVSVLLSACGSIANNTEMSREDHEKPLEMGKENNNDISDRKSSNEASKRSTEESNGFKPVDIDQIDFENGDWIALDFKHPDVQLVAPSYVNDWPVKDFDIQTSMSHSAIYRNTDTITDGQLNGVMIRISANYSDEPEPKYKKEMFDKPDSLGGETLEWSFEDHLFKKHHRYNGNDSFTCYYTPEGYKLEVYIQAPTEEIEKYRDDFLIMAEQLRNAPIDVEEPLSEELIIEKCRAYYDSPYAEIDHYNDDGSFVVHCYEIVDDGQETHMATWGWIVVDPKKKTTYDDITMEPIEGIFE